MQNRIQKFSVKLIFTFVLFACIFLAGCATNQIVRETNYYSDIPVESVVGKNFHLYMFPLDFEKIEIVAFPQEKDIGKNGWYQTVYTRDFARKNDCFIAFDTSPFEVLNIVQHAFFSRKIVGVHKLEGKVLCEMDDYFSALCFDGEKGWIAENQVKEDIDKADYAFGGFFTVLKDGKIIPFSEVKDLRMAVGISEGGKKFYVLTGSDMSFNESAQILLSYGCTDAMHFDGGSSTQIYVKNGYVTPVCVPPGASIGFRIRK